MQRQVRLSAVDRPRRGERTQDRPHRVAELRAESRHRRVREWDTRNDMVNDEPIRAKHQVGKSHHQSMGREQNCHGPVVQLVTVPESEGLEVGEVA